MSRVLSLGEDAGSSLRSGEPVLMHDPVGLGPRRGLSPVEDQNLPHPDDHLAAPGRRDLLVLPCGLPVPGPRRPVRPATPGVLRLPQIEEVPLLLAPT